LVVNVVHLIIAVMIAFGDMGCDAALVFLKHKTIEDGDFALVGALGVLIPNLHLP